MQNIFLSQGIGHKCSIELYDRHSDGLIVVSPHVIGRALRFNSSCHQNYHTWYARYIEAMQGAILVILPPHYPILLTYYVSSSNMLLSILN